MQFYLLRSVSAVLAFSLLSANVTHAGIFGGNSELGVIKQSTNVFKFISPPDETIDNDSLLLEAARTAKALGFSYFLIELPNQKPAPKSTGQVGNPTDMKTSDQTAEMPPLTSVTVYFYNSPRQRNGNKTIAVTDIIPADNDTPPQEQPAPVVEKIPAPVAEEPIVEKKPKKAAKTDVAPADQPAPVVEEPIVEKKPKKAAKTDVAPAEPPAPVVEKIPAPVAEEPIVEKKPKKAAKTDVAPAEQPAPVVEKEKLSIENVLPSAANSTSFEKTMQRSTKTGVPPNDDQATNADGEALPVKKVKRKPRQPYLPEEGGMIPVQNGQVRDLGDLFH